MVTLGHSDLSKTSGAFNHTVLVDLAAEFNAVLPAALG
jgi:hypothetical protein